MGDQEINEVVVIREMHEPSGRQESTKETPGATTPGGPGGHGPPTFYKAKFLCPNFAAMPSFLKLLLKYVTLFIILIFFENFSLC